MCGRLCLFFVIMAEVSVAVSQLEIKEDKNIETIRNKISMEQIHKKLEDMVLLIEDNRLLSWNLLKNSLKVNLVEMSNLIEENNIETEKKIHNYVKNSMEEFKKDFTIMMETRFNESKSHILKVNEKLSSEVNNVISNVTSENKIIASQLNELKKQFKDQSSLDNNNRVNELNDLKQLNSKTNLFCENRINDLVVHATNCADLRFRGDNKSGIRFIAGINVVCDQETDGGGWTVFQTRMDLPIRENFYRNWTDYSNGFGELSGEFWLGLRHIHTMTQYPRMELRIDLEDENGIKRFAKYQPFSIGNSLEKFRLNVGVYSGNAGDDLTYSNQEKFSTNDQDNDQYDGNCALQRKGGWWYKECTATNLNGFQFVGNYSDAPPLRQHGIQWKGFRGYQNSLKSTKMMFRPQ